LFYFNYDQAGDRARRAPCAVRGGESGMPPSLPLGRDLVTDKFPDGNFPPLRGLPRRFANRQTLSARSRDNVTPARGPSLPFGKLGHRCAFQIPTQAKQFACSPSYLEKHWRREWDAALAAARSGLGHR